MSGHLPETILKRGKGGFDPPFDLHKQEQSNNICSIVDSKSKKMKRSRIF
jgi:hypothetical protein